jgi:hypothetical protein
MSATKRPFEAEEDAAEQELLKRSKTAGAGEEDSLSDAGEGASTGKKNGTDVHADVSDEEDDDNGEGFT